MADSDKCSSFIERVRKETRQWLSSPSLYDEIPLREEIREALLTPSEDRFTRLRNFYDLVKKSGVDLSSELKAIAFTFGYVLKYASNALKYREREEHRAIKMYSAFYKCSVESSFIKAQQLFEMMGFRAEDEVLRLPEGVVDEEKIFDVEVDLMFAQEEIQILCQLLGKFESSTFAKLSNALSARKRIQHEKNLQDLTQHVEAMAHIALEKQLPLKSKSAERPVSSEEDSAAASILKMNDLSARPSRSSSSSSSFDQSRTDDAIVNEQEGYDEVHGGEQSGRRISFDRPISDDRKLPAAPVWVCPHCTLNNRTLKNVCESCLKPRDFSLDPSPVGVVCPNCSFVLDVKLHNVKSSCPQCENPYPLQALNKILNKDERFV